MSKVKTVVEVVKVAVQVAPVVVEAFNTIYERISEAKGGSKKISRARTGK